MKKYSILIVLIFLIFSCQGKQEKQIQSAGQTAVQNKNTDSTNQIVKGKTGTGKTHEYAIQVLRSFEHDPRAYTQGLFYYNGFLFESTGLNSFSSLRKLDAQSGKILKKISVPNQYFAEGIAVFDNKIYQLTWESNICLVYDINTFNQIATFNYFGEGWGLTNNDEYLIMSDGTNNIRIINPDNFQLVRTLSIYDEKDRPVSNINELELIKGEIWANIWQTDKIAKIDPNTGIVNGWIDLSELRKSIKDVSNIEVLNGIAFDKEGDRIFVTGKRWPLMFEIKILEK